MILNGALWGCVPAGASQSELSPCSNVVCRYQSFAGCFRGDALWWDAPLCVVDSAVRPLTVVVTVAFRATASSTTELSLIGFDAREDVSGASDVWDLWD